MQTLLYPFLWLATFGFLASLLVHVRALGELTSPFGRATWLLHLGIFVVLLPAIYVSMKAAGGASKSHLRELLLRGCPDWMRTGLYLVVVYGVLNFILFLAAVHPYPKGAEVPEYISYRGFSGHWMVFYYAAAAMLYASIRSAE